MKPEPYYDWRTNTIYNATEGSYSWYHEKRHQWQFNTFTWLGNTLEKLQAFALYASVASPSIFLFGDLNDFIMLIGLWWSPYSVLMFIIETDAFIMGSLSFLWFKIKGMIQ